jgi:hypothetical protein
MVVGGESEAADRIANHRTFIVRVSRHVRATEPNGPQPKCRSGRSSLEASSAVSCWRDFDLDAGTVSIQRTIGVVRNEGDGAQIVEKVPTAKRFAPGHRHRPRDGGRAAGV